MNWRDYEAEILSYLQNQFPNDDLRPDQRLLGRYSKAHRQIDILMANHIARYPVRGVVDCKCFAMKVDVKVVDQFVGFMADVEAHIGILITNKGYTPAAQERAKSDPQSIYLEIIPFEKLSKWKFDQLSIFVPFALKTISDRKNPRNSDWKEFESLIFRYLDAVTPRFQNALHELPSTSISIILALANPPYSKGISSLAAELNITSKTISAHVRRLLKSRYIEAIGDKYRVSEPRFAIWHIWQTVRSRQSIWSLMEPYLLHLAKENGYRDANYVSTHLLRLEHKEGKKGSGGGLTSIRK